MKTIIKITNDYFTNIAYDHYKEDINYLVNELDVFCIVKNNDFINIVNDERKYITHNKGSYKNSIQIEAKGYSQGEWQSYILYYNQDELKTPQQRMYFSDLIKQLERTFTHQNNYSVEKFDQTIINGKKFNSDPYDFTIFCISHTEFPDEDDVKKEYLEIYGQDFDECIIILN